ncbi:MAG: hypothetical protein AB7F74_29730 [Parvibaculaceae bacterium]
MTASALIVPARTSDRKGRAAYELRPVFDALIADLKRSTKLFMTEVRCWPSADIIRRRWLEQAEPPIRL